MPKFIVERDILGIGGAAPEGLRSAAEKSNEVLNELGSNIQWVESYIAGDKTYCLYIAPHEELIRKHAEIVRTSDQSHREDPGGQLIRRPVRSSLALTWRGQRRAVD